jgi:outer membrane protein TolC
MLHRTKHSLKGKTKAPRHDLTKGSWQWHPTRANPKNQNYDWLIRKKTARSNTRIAYNPPPVGRADTPPTERADTPPTERANGTSNGRPVTTPKLERTPQTRPNSSSEQPRVSESGQDQSEILAEPPPLPQRSDQGQPRISLAEVYRLARQNNLDLRILRERVVQAEIMRAKAWVILKPQLQIQGSYTRNDTEVVFDIASSFKPLIDSMPEPFKSQIKNSMGSAEPMVISPQNQLGFQLQLQWAFFNLQSIPILQIAYLAVEQVGHTAHQVRREILFAATRAYYGILLTDGMVDISRRLWQNSREHLRIAQARYRAGVAPELMVTRAMFDVAKARQSFIQAENGLQNAKLAMALLLNRPHFNFRPIRPQQPSLPEGDFNRWQEIAIQQRPELKASRIAIEIAQKQIHTSWMKFLPTVALIGTLRGSNATGFSDQYTQWSVMLAAQLQLYSGGSRYMDLQEAFSKLRQSRLELAKNSAQINNEIRQAELSLSNTQVALQVAQQQLRLAQRGLHLTEVRYKAGMATPVEVSDALIGLQSSEIQVLQESLSRELSILSLQRAIGKFRAR